MAIHGATRSPLGVIGRIGLMGVTLTTACSFTGPRRVACDDHAACRESFGLGAVCGEGGYCERAEPHPRCDRTFPANLQGRDPADTVLLGALHDLGLEAHRARERATQLAVKQVDAQGGIDGVEFALALCTVEEDPELDDLTQEEAALSVARWLHDIHEVPALLGPSSSPLVQAVFLELRDEGTVIMSPAASSPILTTLETDIPGRLWRTTPPDTLQGDAIALDMRGPGPGREGPVDQVAVVHEAGAYGDGLAEAFYDAFTGLGGVATLHRWSDPTQIGATLTRAGLDPGTEVLLIAQTAHAITMANVVAATPAFDGKAVFVTDTAATADFIDQVDPTLFSRLRGSRPAPLDPRTDFGYAAFLASYRAEYGEDAAQHSFTAHAYDAAWLVMAGAAWSLTRHGAVVPEHIADGLTRIGDGAPLEVGPSSWQRLVVQFRAGDAVDLEGVSGELDYDPITEELSGPVEIWVVSAGALTAVDTWVP